MSRGSWLAMTLLMGCSTPSWKGKPAVVVLVLDGVRPEESLGDAASTATGEHPSEILPQVWDALLPTGARAVSALNTGVTITTPAHCELLSGRRQSLANYPVSGDVGLYRPEMPTLPESLLIQHGLPAEQAILTGNTGFIEAVGTSLWPSHQGGPVPLFSMSTYRDSAAIPATTDRAVFEDILGFLKEEQPQFLLANLHASDRTGHNEDGDAYIDEVRRLDHQLVDFWSDFQRLPGYKDTGYVFIVADHGRHRSASDDPPWRNHGDDCLGCRHVPLLILGPDVQAGLSYSEPVLLSDVGATIAALLDVALPSAVGHPLQALFTEPLGAEAPTGPLEVSAAGGSLAESRLSSDPAHRSQVFVDGIQVSSPDALAAEAPVLLADDASDRQWLCFRELHADLSADEMPWEPRCLTRFSGETWEALPQLAARVGPLWRPVLLSEGDVLTVHWIHNPNGSGTQSDYIGLHASVLEDDAWVTTEVLMGISYPDHLSVLPTGTAVFAGTMESGSESRHSRRLFLADTAGRALSMVPAVGDVRYRVERSALFQSSDGGEWLAALVHTEERTHLVVAEPQSSWTPVELTVPLPILPHVTPVWGETHDGEAAVLFGVLDDDSPQLCVARPDQSDASCTALAGEFLHMIAVDAGTAYATVRAESGVWSVVTLDWETLL